ncbi:MAG: twin-arginine translocase subunit TatC, partial [Candidatus Eisenbacteria bacterium]|nr:twin-arginine translocase subunit TatC [Candidatus Eisenbacteria bacterium]
WFDPRKTGGDMHFLEHLEELRRLLQHVIGGVVVGALGGWWLAPRVLADLIARTVKTTVVMSPFEAFNERLKLAALIGLMIALPYVLWRVWSFVVPGLLRRERKWILPLSVMSCILFAGGAYVAYAYVVPLVVRMLEQFLTPGMISQIRLSFLLDFFYNMALACGVMAQLPLVTMLLTAMGLVTPVFLLKQWRIAMVVIFVVTAAITPGDVVSAQVVMGGPMALLYFMSVGLSFLVARRNTRAEADEAAPPDEGEPRNA